MNKNLTDHVAEGTLSLTAPIVDDIRGQIVRLDSLIETAAANGVLPDGVERLIARQTELVSFLNERGIKS